MIGKKYTKPLMLVMLVAFFTSIVCSEILFKQVHGIDVVNNAIKNKYIVLIVFRDICNLVCLAILLWLGTYYVLMKKMLALSILAVLIGLFIPIGQGLNVLLQRHTATQYVNTLNDPQSIIQDYKTTMNNKSIPQEKRIRNSKIDASLIYEMSGKSMQIMDPDGKLEPYVPTQKDIEQRNQFKQSVLQIHINQTKMLFSVLGTFIITILSVVAAFFCYRSDKRALSKLASKLSR